MQKLLRKVLLLALMFVPFVTMAQGTFFTCDFEDDADTVGWSSMTSSTENSTSWVIDTAVHNGSGTKGLYLSTNNGANHQYNMGSSVKTLCYKTIELTSGSYDYSYDWLANGESNYDYLRVALVPSSVELSTSANVTTSSMPDGWIALDGGSKLNSVTTWETVTGSFYIPVDGDYKLVFWWRNDYGGGTQPPAAIDNISLTIPTCPMPVDIIVSNIESESATLTWTETGNATSWIVEYHPEGQVAGSESSYTEQVSDIPTVTLMGLNANTVYKVSIIADCGSEQSDTATTTFRTACGIMELPYFANFTDEEVNTFPSCWTQLYNQDTKIDARSGNNTIKFAACGGVASPKVPLAGNMISLEFKLQREGTNSGVMQVGFTTDLSNLDNMVVVKTITPSDNNFNSYDVDFSVMGENATEEGYIVFHQTGTDRTNWYYWLDDVKIRQLSDCRRPTSMVANNVTYMSATLSWDEVEGVSQYEVAYGTADAAEPNSAQHTIVSDVSGNFLDIADLESETTYYIWVRSMCGGENSIWRSGQSFTTQIGCAPLEDVTVTGLSTNGAAFSWSVNASVGAPATNVVLGYKKKTDTDYTIVNTTNNYYILGGLEAGTSYEYYLNTICDTDTASAITGTFTTLPCGVSVAGGTSTTTNLPSHMYYKYSYSQMLYTAEELSGLDTIRGIAFNYTNDATEPRTIDVYMGHVKRSALHANNPVRTDSLTLVANDYQYTVAKGWTQIVFDTPFIYSSDSNLVIVIDDNTNSYGSSKYAYYHEGGISLYKNGYSDIDPANALDLREFEGVPDIVFCTTCSNDVCAAPLLTVSEVNTTDVNLVWAAGGVDDNWVVEYKLTSETEWTEFETTNVTNSTVTGLQPGSFYQARVGSICGTDTLFSNVEFITACAAVNIPYTEDFSADNLNPCIVTGSITGENSPYLSSHAMAMSYKANTYFILPEIVEELNTVRLFFDMKADNLNSSVMIAIGTDPNDWSTFQAVDTIYNSEKNVYERQLSYFNNYTGAGKYIAIRSLASYIYIDNITVEEIPVCAVPMDVVVNNITFESADVRWNGDNGSSDNWTVTYINTAMNDTLEEVVTESFCTLTGLATDTPYEVIVKNNCNGEVISALRTIKFRTLCSTIVLPYQEGFEHKVLGQRPTCWSFGNGEYKVISSQGNTALGEQSLMMKGNSYIASPYVPLAGNSIAVDFVLQRESAVAGKIIVGFTTDLANVGTMERVDTIQPSNDLNNTYEIDFSNVTSTEEGYIIWQQVDASTYSYADNEYYLDDIFIREMSNCVRPESVSISQVTNDQAVVSWTAVEGATQYEVMYSIVDDMNADVNQMATTSENSLTITDLEGNTTYYVWVRNLCSSSSYSDWRKADAFTTQVDCARLSDVEVTNITVNGLALSWMYQGGVGNPATQVEVGWRVEGTTDPFTTAITNNDYYIVGGLESNTNYEFRLRTICTADTAEAYTINISTPTCGVTIAGDNSTFSGELPIECYREMSYTQSVYPADQLIGVDSIKSVGFHLKSSQEIIRSLDVYMGHINRSTLTPTTYVTMDSLTKVASNFVVSLQSGDEWMFVTLDSTFVYNQTSNLVIAIDDNSNDWSSGVKFFTHSGSSLFISSDTENPDPAALTGTMSAKSVVPDIVFPTPCADNLCSSPLLVVSETTTNSASLVWGQGNVGDSWTIQYKLSDATDWTEVSTNVIDTFYTISNLQPGTFYDFRVGTNCSEGVKYSTVQGFTQCAAISAPIVENFDRGGLNPCWTAGNLTNSGKPSALSSSLYMGSNANGYVVMPEFVNNISTLHALFSVKAPYSQTVTIVVAIGTSNTDYASFVPIDTVVVNTTDFVPQECSFADYTGDGHYIAFLCPSGNGYIDDITIEEIPSCSLPTNLAVTNITSDAATITWEGNNALTQSWIVEYNIQGSSNVISQTLAANTYSYTMTGLVANSDYEVIVRNVCASDTVAALAPISFRTECGVMTLPFVETFEAETVGEYHSCWFTSGFSTYDNETAPEISLRSDEHGKVMKFGDNVDIITELIPTKANKILLNFDAKVESSIYSGDLVIGFVNETTDTNIIAIDTIFFDHQDWENYEYSFAGLNITDTGYVIFKNINNRIEQGWYSSYYNGFIDNVTFSIDNGCSRVTNIAISGVTPTSIDINFTDTTNSGNYTIGYSQVDDVNNITDTITISSTAYTITGLQPNTRYYAWVRNNCVAGGSPWAAAPIFKTPCYALNTIPYVENFDSYTTDISTGASTPTTYPNHTLPDCWNFINMNPVRTKYPQAFLSQYNGYPDSASCLLMKSSKDDPLYVVLPKFTVPVDSLAISFKYRNESVSDYNGHLTLGVMTDISDTNSFTVIREFPQIKTLTSVYHNFGVDGLNSNEDYVIVFRYTGGRNSNYYLSLDNVVVDRAPDCATPELLAVNGVTINTATLSWMCNSDRFNVQYREISDSTWTSINGVFTPYSTTTIQGLTSNTTYVARVQASCGTSVSEWTEPIEFTTLCTSVAVPYSENFDSYNTDIANLDAPDSYPNHTLPSCWTFPNLEDGAQVFLSDNSGYVHANNGLMFSSADDMSIYAVLPEMDVRVDSLRIKFAYCNEGTSASNGVLSVGLMTNPNDLSTFILSESYPYSSTLANAEHSFSVDTTIIPDTTYYIAFRYEGHGNNYYLGLDDIEVDLAPTCVRPVNLDVVSVGSTDVNLNWLGSASNYEVNYKLAADSVWSSVITTNTTYTITNLLPVNSYNARVRALCSATDTSEWSNTVSFTTDCAVYNMPFSEDFTVASNSLSDLQCWERYKGLLSDVLAGTADLESTYSGWSSYGTTYQVNNGGTNVHLNIYSTNCKSWLVSPSINITAGAALKFDLARRDYNNDWDADDKFVVLATNDNGVTWTPLQTWQDSTYSNIALYSGVADSINISLNQYANSAIKIAFYGESTVKGADHFVYVDNIEIASAVPSCATPTDLAVTDLTYSSATLSWNGTASAYDVEYREQGATDWISTTMSETTLALTDLTPLTTYEWQVRGNCGDAIGTSAWESATFTTLELPCPMPTNVTATAEGNTVTIDWTAEEGQSSWEVIVYDLDTVKQTVSAHPVTFEGLNGATTYNVQVRSLCAADVQSTWTDAIQVTTASCGIVTDVAATEITDNSAKITWSAAGDEAKWEINYGEAGFAQGQGEIVEATTTSFTLTNLESEMPYDVYVRAVCGNDFYGLWSNKISFETLPTDTPEGIDGVEGQFQFAIYPNPTHGATTISLNGVEGQVTISVVDMNGRTITSESIECGSDCEKRIDVAGLAQGTYFVRVLGDNINSVRKLIVR